MYIPKSKLLFKVSTRSPSSVIPSVPSRQAFSLIFRQRVHPDTLPHRNIEQTRLKGNIQSTGELASVALRRVEPDSRRIQRSGTTYSDKRLMKRYLSSLPLLFLLGSSALLGQSNSGELRIKVTDPSGAPVRTEVVLVSEANDFHKTLPTDDSGALTLKRLPFGVYRVQITHSGFTDFADNVEVRSAIPADYIVKLTISAPNTSVTVTDSDTLIDPHATGNINRIGSEAISNRPSSLPGRSLQDLVNSQPGWLYEGNAVLHPRGSEYQTQFVVDGLPLIDNRSPSFGPEIEADDVQSLGIYTASFPAEYGRKMGGVVEVNTVRDSRQG